MVFPELLGCVFACYAREDLLSAWEDVSLRSLSMRAMKGSALPREEGETNQDARPETSSNRRHPHPR